MENHITIYISKKIHCSDEVKAYTRNRFFKDEYVFKVTEDKVLFERVYVDTAEKPRKAWVTEDGAITMHLGSVSGYDFDVPPGKYPIDTYESNSDQIVIYFEDVME